MTQGPAQARSAAGENSSLEDRRSPRTTAALWVDQQANVEIPGSSLRDAPE